MKLIIFSLIFFSISTLSCFPQAFTIANINALGDQYMFEKSKMNTLGGVALTDIEGSPYLSDEFISGEVIINDSILIENVPLRYNMYSDRMEFMNAANQILEIDQSNKHYRFKIGSQTFVNRNYSNDGALHEGIFERLNEGKISLYKKYRVELKEATKAIGFQEAQPNKFVRNEDEYYLGINNNTPVAAGNTKKLIALLEQFKPELEAYIKSEKLKLKKESDLIRLVQYCNE